MEAWSDSRGAASYGALDFIDANSTVVAANPDTSFARLEFSGDNSNIVYETDTSLGSLRVSPSSATLELERAASNDITSFAVGNMDLAGETTSSVVILPGAPGQGHFTFQVARSGAGETTGSGIGAGPAIVTSSDSTVELVEHGVSRRRGIFAAENERISGDGDVLMNMDSAGGLFSLYGVLTYTGRTMLETGVLQLNSAGTEWWQIGQLPTATIVEVGENATLDLNGIDQQVGGLSGFNATIGEVTLGGGALTIHSDVATNFPSAAILGDGALIKSGSETFTLVGDYINPAGRTLRVEGGILEVDGDLTIQAGVFELAGGRISLENDQLFTVDQLWRVTLTASTEEQNLLSVWDADITGAQLAVTLEDGYDPALGTEFTLLYAENMINGADATNMFGFSDGQLVRIGSTPDGDPLWAFINWVEGSESIVLSVIPEPGSAMLVLIGLGWLLGRRRLTGWAQN